MRPRVFHLLMLSHVAGHADEAGQLSRLIPNRCESAAGPKLRPVAAHAPTLGRAGPVAHRFLHLLPRLSGSDLLRRKYDGMLPAHNLFGLVSENVARAWAPTVDPPFHIQREYHIIGNIFDDDAVAFELGVVAAQRLFGGLLRAHVPRHFGKAMQLTLRTSDGGQGYQRPEFGAILALAPGLGLVAAIARRSSQLLLGNPRLRILRQEEDGEVLA